jgi:hypothetical protein
VDRCGYANLDSSVSAMLGLSAFEEGSMVKLRVASYIHSLGNNFHPSQKPGVYTGQDWLYTAQDQGLVEPVC